MPSSLFYQVLVRQATRQLKQAHSDAFEAKPLERIGTVITSNVINISGQRYPLVDALDVPAGSQLKVQNIRRPADAIYSPSRFGGTSVTGGGGTPAKGNGDTVTEGPGIDIVEGPASKAIGLGGDTILLYDSGLAPVREYAADTYGLDAALAAATAGDVVWLPAGTIAGNHTIPAGVTVQGMGENTALSGTITNNGTLFMVKVGSVVVLYQKGTAPGLMWDQANNHMGIGIVAPAKQLHIDAAAGDADIRLSSTAGTSPTLQLYKRAGANYDGWALVNDITTDDFAINRDTSEDTCAFHALYIDKDSGFLTAYLPGVVRLSDVETYQRFVITAHRGDINPADGYPENTVAAALSAARKGAHRIECDPRLSADGTWYLMHDASVDRTTNGSGNVVAKTDAQLDAMNIDGGYGYRAAHAGLYHPAKLSAVLVALAPYDVTLQLDNKVPADAGTLAEYIAGQGWAQRVAINAYSQAEAQAIKAVSRWIAVIGTAGWAETDILTLAPGTTEAAILADAPCQVHIAVPITDYNISDIAAQTLDAYNTGARGIISWDIDASLAELYDILFLGGHLAASDPHPQYELEANLNEDIDDRVAALLQEGANITLTYNDGANTLTIASTGGGSYWEPVTNGDVATPEIIFHDGDVVMVEV